MVSVKLDIHAYFNYRDFLRDHYRARKDADPYFSHRSFARVAGFSSSAFYPLLVQGLRNLTPRYVPGFIKALKLTTREAEYFQLMLEYTHAVTDLARQDVFSRMIPYLPDKVKRLRLGQKELYAQWFHSVVHQALAAIDITDDLRPLCKFVSPNITLSEAKLSIQVLSELELIHRDQAGCWRPSHTSLVGGPEVGALYIHNFQGSMLDLGKTAHERFPLPQRLQVTETFAVGTSAALRIRERLREAHREIVEIILQDHDPARQVMQLNLQHFPVTLEKELVDVQN